MAKAVLALRGYRGARPETVAFSSPDESCGGITLVRRCLVAPELWLQEVQRCWWVVAS